MRRILPYVALLVFSFILIQPAFNENVICADDLQAHLHKAFALELSIRDGNFFPRWVPDMARGYGYPLFNFYAPLSSYPLVAIHLLGASYPTAIIITLALYLYLAGVGMFLFTRDLFDDGAAIVSAIAYMSAPYMGFDIIFRGALAEVSGWMWIPLALWAIRRAIIHSSWRWAIVGAICYAALIPSHNLLALMSTPLIAGWVVIQLLEIKDWRRIHFGIVPIVLGLSLTAYFWLPVLAERGLVRTDRLLDSTVLQYANNFLAPSELFSQWTADPLLTNPSPPRGLGLIMIVLAILGALTLIKKFRWSIFYLALVTLGYCFLTLAISQPIWDVTPLMPFFQFPWRMLTPATLGAAVLVGALFSIKIRYITPLQTLLACAALTFFNISWWAPTYCGVIPPTAPEAIRQFRTETFMEGAHSYSEYLPMWVQKFPQDDALFNNLVNGESPERLVIANAQVQSRSSNILNAEYVINTLQTTEALYKQFYYPGWQVEIDGAQIDIQPKDETGVIRFAVPQGSHLVKIRFGETLVRSAADAVSALAVLVCVFIFITRKDFWVQKEIDLQNVQSLKSWMALIVLGLSFFALKVFVLDRSHSSSFDGEKISNTRPLRTSLAGGVELYGYEVNSTVASGDWFDVTLYAGTLQKIDRAFVPTMRIEDTTGLVWSDPNVTFPRWLRPPFSANLWEANQYALWARRVTLLPATPPGTYRLWGEVFDVEDSAHTPASVLDANGNTLAPRFDLGTITVTPPTKPAAIESLKMQNVSNAKLNDSLLLLGWNVDRSKANAGDMMLLTLFWKLEKETLKDQKFEVELSDELGKRVFVKEIDAVSENFPTSRWKMGDVWRGQHWIRLPATLAAGGYRLGITLKGEPVTALSRIGVSAPQRSFIAPSVDQKVGARFSDVTELVGYSLRDEKIILVWRALKTLDVSYSVFVHLTNGDRIWAQSDGVPQNWARPTTGWVEGEYVVDERAITLPTDAPRGEYVIYVGMVDVATGKRLEEPVKVGVIIKK